MAAAEHEPTLRALFGPREKVTRYKTWQVFHVITVARDRATLMDRAQAKLSEVKK